MKQHLSPGLMILLFVCVLFFSSPLAMTQAAPPADIRTVALEGLGRFVDLEEEGNIVLGDGFQVFTVVPQRLLENRGETLGKMIIATDLWRFMVLEDGKTTGLLTVAKVNGNWQAVSFGAAGLAAEIQAIQNAWPGDRGFETRFIRIYQARSDFLQISKSGDPLGYAPLAAAKLSLSLQSFRLEPSALLHDSEILEPLKKLVKQTVSTGAKLENGNR